MFTARYGMRPYIQQIRLVIKWLSNYPYRVFRFKQKECLLFSALSGFGGLEVACWPLVPKFAGSHPAEAVGILGRKNPQKRLPSEGK